MAENTAQGMEKYTPWADVVELDDGMHIYLDMPGVARESLEIDVDKDQLRVSGATSYPQDPFAGSKERASHVEFGGGRYERRFTLADNVDRERISATLRNGVLDVHLPKSEQAQPKRIQVQAG